MVCINIDRISNCGRCTFYLSNLNVLANTRAINIAKTANSILWADKLSSETDCTGTVYNISISCTGFATVNRKGELNYISYASAIILYKEILKTWFKVRKNYLTLHTINMFQSQIICCEESKNINKIRQESIKLVNYLLEKRKYADTTLRPVSEQEIEYTAFTFSNMSQNSKLSSVNIMRIMVRLIMFIRDKKMFNTFPDLDTFYMTYEGKAIFADTVVRCESTITQSKKMYSEYLNSWCKSNYNNSAEIRKIKKSIDLGIRAYNIEELYDISILLLSSLKQIQNAKPIEQHK